MNIRARAEINGLAYKLISPYPDKDTAPYDKTTKLAKMERGESFFLVDNRFFLNINYRKISTGLNIILAFYRERNSTVTKSSIW